MMLNLAEQMAAYGNHIDLVVVKAKSAHLRSISPEINLIRLGTSHTFSSIKPLVKYLRTRRPDALLAAKDRANIVAIMARKIARVPTRLIIRMGTTVSAALEGKNNLKMKFWYLRMRIFYPFADKVIAVSHGVADDLATNARLSPKHINVIENPVITTRIQAMAGEPIEHRWFSEKEVPVIMGAGRLTRQKDFPTLIKAFSLVRAIIPCRLVILGEGQDRDSLKRLAQDLGVEEDIDLPGFTPNPYNYMRNSDVFVLSSAWEGSPNVLTEALAIGTPVVSTDCPSGPREILQQGRICPLVNVGDFRAMARAIVGVIKNPPEKSILMDAVKEYTVENSARKYLEVLLGSAHPVDEKV